MKQKIILLCLIIIISIFTVTGFDETDAYINEEIIENAEIFDEEDEDRDVSRKDYEEETRKLEELVERALYLRWRTSGIDLEKQISADSFLVIKLSDDEHFVYLRKNDDRRYPLASITKLMSSVIAAENIDAESTIVLTEPMLRSYGHSPSLFPGARVRAHDLMMAALTQSTNDATECLTYFMSEGTFLGLMNIKAHEIGMENSFFFDSHGLSPKNQATAGDVVKLLEYVYKVHPKILEMTRVEDFRLPNPYGTLLTFRNFNMFHDIPDFIGGKTGYLPEAKQTYTSLFNVGDETFAVVILMSESRKDDLQTIFEWLNKNPRLRN